MLSPFYNIGENWMTKHTKKPIGSGIGDAGRTRSGAVYNVHMADCQLHTQYLTDFDMTETEATQRAMDIWSQCFMDGQNWLEGEHADALALAKALCNEARQLHVFMKDCPKIQELIGVCASTLLSQIHDGTAPFAACRDDFAPSYADNLCSIIIGSVETGNWKWAKEGELEYY